MFVELGSVSLPPDSQYPEQPRSYQQEAGWLWDGGPISTGRRSSRGEVAQAAGLPETEVLVAEGQRGAIGNVQTKNVHGSTERVSTESAEVDSAGILELNSAWSTINGCVPRSPLEGEMKIRPSDACIVGDRPRCRVNPDDARLESVRATLAKGINSAGHGVCPCGLTGSQHEPAKN